MASGQLLVSRMPGFCAVGAGAEASAWEVADGGAPDADVGLVADDAGGSRSASPLRVADTCAGGDAVVAVVDAGGASEVDVLGVL
jgi:hypothetical protein